MRLERCATWDLDRVTWGGRAKGVGTVQVRWDVRECFVGVMEKKQEKSLGDGSDLKRELRVSCYTNAGYLMDANDLKSQTRYVFILNGGAVDWKSAKQSIFATSSAEDGYIATFDASKEAVWDRKFIYELGVVPKIKEPISMYCDNTGAIAIANASGITIGARHLHAKVHYLHEVIEHGDIKLEKVHTDDNLADPFTKALAYLKHSEHTRNIGMFPTSSLMDRPDALAINYFSSQSELRGWLVEVKKKKTLKIEHSPREAFKLHRLLVGKKALQSKWVFKVKEELYGCRRHKARLMVKLQDNDIFSPVVKMTKIRLVLRRLPSVLAEKVALKGFSASEYRGCLDSRKSTTGYVFTKGGTTVCWMFRLEKYVAMTTTQAGYVVVLEAGKELVH
nr:hypothetical protein [Tanacetum cinerariifolium]